MEETRMGNINCDKCRWYKVGMRELDLDQKEYQRLALKFEGKIIRFDTRACIMGGCNGSKFENKGE